MDLNYEAQKMLNEAGYDTSTLTDKGWLLFEDESLFGFISVHPNAAEILRTWQSFQDHFLNRNATKLRAHPGKAWNAYSVFVTDAACPAELESDLEKIEEDFRGTRKIARTEITSTDELYAALFPLLPIKHFVALTHYNPRPRLEARLFFLRPAELQAVLKGNSPSNVVDILLEGE